jgi:hypothetical protein
MPGVQVARSASRRPSKAYSEQPIRNVNIPVVCKPQPPLSEHPFKGSQHTSTIKALSYLLPFSLSWKRKGKIPIVDESPVNLDVSKMEARDIATVTPDQYNGVTLHSLSPADRQRLRRAESNKDFPSVPTVSKFVNESIEEKVTKNSKLESAAQAPSSPIPNGTGGTVSPLPSKQRTLSKAGVSSTSNMLLKHPRSSSSTINKSGNNLSPNRISNSNVSGTSNAVNPSVALDGDELHHHYPYHEKYHQGLSISLIQPTSSNISSISASHPASQSSFVRKKLQQVVVVSEENQLSSPITQKSSPNKEQYNYLADKRQSSEMKPNIHGTTFTKNSSLLSRFANVSRTSAMNANIESAKDDDASALSDSLTHPMSTATTTGGTPKVLCCDKCDGKHETDDCPYYKKKREAHPDAQRNKGRQIGGTSLLPGGYITNARVIRQPGDGSCLFHSMAFGLGGGHNANRLRSEICSFIQANPQLLISETPLKEWVKWDSGCSVSDYVRKMSRSSWGGGIEMASLSQMKQVNVHVYERSGMGFKRISAFDVPVDAESRPIVRVLYGGGVHYGRFQTF